MRDHDPKTDGRARNADAPEAKRIVYRIGVSLGDVLIEGDDILGDGVNIAARLEGICEPGQVLISRTAFENVRGKIDANFVDLGEKMAWAELGLGHFDAAIEESSKAIDAGSTVWFTYLCLATAQGLKGDIDDAKKALAEARRLNPKLNLKWMMGSKFFPNYTQAWFDALPRRGCRRRECLT